MLKRDKQKVTDEVWDDARIRSFLFRLPPPCAGDCADFYRLLGAYQGMRIDDFRRFLDMFVAAGGDLDAHDDKDRTCAQYIAGHRHAAPFIKAIDAQRAGAPAAAPVADADASPSMSSAPAVDAN